MSISARPANFYISRIIPIALVITLSVIVGWTVAISVELAWLSIAFAGLILILTRPDVGPFLLVGFFIITFGVHQELDVQKLVFPMLFGVVFFSWLLNRNKAMYHLPLFSRRLTRPSVALGLLIIVSIIPALMNGTSLTDWFRDASNYANYLLIVPVSSLLKSRSHAKLMAVLLLVWSFIVSLATISAGSYFVSGPLFFLGERLPFSASPAWCLSVILIGMALWVGLRMLPNAANRWFARACLGVLILLALAGLIAAGYRFAFFSLAISMAIFVALGSMRDRSLWIRVPVLLALGLVAFGILGPLFPLDLRGFLDKLMPVLTGRGSVATDLSFQAKLAQMSKNLQEFYDAPLLGKGFGYEAGYLLFSGKYVEEGFFAHNSYTGLLMKTGIIGFSIVVWFLYAVVRALLKARKVAHGTLEWFYFGLVLSIIGVGVFSLSEASIDNRTFSSMISISVALGARLQEWYHARRVD